ncbi:type II toxin-antitoxin system PemK/MazF family toxin [Paenibacillus psychroresistens]|uniref:mRNA interferase n=1 Tax=Paenibacillus psychroresistens TaxID=1778678 RepID=A0A6B8RIE5_9BACL|nr:type II toxin-antitoxin system PemK/MazF family toxin [Paenibacillus psychroresistens]QGQ95303.1 type II toxin-antitoxin system PemK/MazF family toxin [Paenibacillus psychroresistens]
MVELQWGIYWVDLTPTKESEQSGTRPVIVISAEEVNISLPVVTVVALTSVKPGRKVYSIEVLLDATATGLSKDSIAMAHQIRSISKDRLIGRCGQIDSEEIKAKVRKAIKIFLDLE